MGELPVPSIRCSFRTSRFADLRLLMGLIRPLTKVVEGPRVTSDALDPTDELPLSEKEGCYRL